MLSNDGTYEIYLIQFRTKNGSGIYKDKWSGISFDCEWLEKGTIRNKAWDDFNASGACWQQTGVHGTYDIDKALSVYGQLITKAEKNIIYDFRVVKVKINQKTEPLWGY